MALPGKSVIFEGFLSPKSGRRKKQLNSLLERGDIGIVYESPFRIVALLEDLFEVSPNARVVLGRELTKIHEELIRGSVSEVLAVLKQKPSIKGEFVVALSHGRNGNSLEEDT